MYSCPNISKFVKQIRQMRFTSVLSLDPGRNAWQETNYTNNVGSSHSTKQPPPIFLQTSDHIDHEF